MTSPIGILGCVSQYDILVTSKTGVALGGLQPSSVVWGRKLDDTSEATIVVTVNPDCCDILSQIHVWHHVVQIFRDGVYVWSGPVVQITGDRTSVTLVAQDLFALLNQRLIHHVLTFSTPTDLTTIATALINDALEQDGHGYTIVSQPSGVLGERVYQPGENALTDLKEVLGLGLDATMLGSQFVLGVANGGKPFGKTATLTCDDFTGDISFTEDGLSLVTRAIVVGNGFIGTAKSPGSDAFGTDPYYGQLEYVSPSASYLTTQAEVDQAAMMIISSRYPAPTTLVLPSGAALSQNAPITIQELVPGVTTTIIADCLCRPATATMVLSQMDVTWDDTGETVAVTYVPVGSTNAELAGAL